MTSTLPTRPLGATGIEVSAVAFGAGPVSGLMTGADRAQQLAVVRCALDAGVNWIDTAATYGAGASEANLGHVLAKLGAADAVHVATKVRLDESRLDDIAGQVTASVEASLQRLRLPRVTLLQLHNSITRERGDEPTSLSAHDVLRAGGVAEAFERMRDRGLVAHLGLTGIGDAGALAEVIDAGRFATIQTPYSLLNPSAGQDLPNGFAEADYGNLIAACTQQRMGVFAIRVFAGGALAGQEPSAHTYKTKFFPLDLYRRDQQRAQRLAEQLLPHDIGLREAAVRYSLSHPSVSAAIIGCGTTAEVDEAMAYAVRGPLPEELLPTLAWWERDR